MFYLLGLPQWRGRNLPLQSKNVVGSGSPAASTSKVRQQGTCVCQVWRVGSEPVLWKEAGSQLIFPIFFFPSEFYGQRADLSKRLRLCGRTMTALSHRFPGQGQLAAESCQNALGTSSVVSFVLFFYEKLPFFFFHL